MAGSSKIVATVLPFLASVGPTGTRPTPAFTASSLRGPGRFAGFDLHTEPGFRDSVRAEPDAFVIVYSVTESEGFEKIAEYVALAREVRTIVLK